MKFLPPLLLLLALTPGLGAQPDTKKTDYGPFFSATIRGPGGNTAMKGIVATLGWDRNAYVCFDTDLMRYSVGWTGDWLKTGNYLKEIVHPQPPEVAGTPLFSTRVGPGWVRGENYTDPRPGRQGPLAKDYAHYRGLFRNGEQTVFSYTVAGMSVLETPGFEMIHGLPVFTRTLDIENPVPGWSLVVAEGNGEPIVGADSLSLIDGDKCLTIAAQGTAHVATHTQHGKLMVRLPAGTGPSLQLRVHIWSGAPADLRNFSEGLGEKAALPRLATLTQGGPARWAETVTTRGVLGTNAGAYVADLITEPVPNPWNTRTFFGGFDFFADGRAAIGTFHGDVWVVSGLDGDLGRLTWKRYAAGLFQPLGLKVMDDVVYVLGRDQITRLRDLNGDGEADSYENFNNDTVVTANYHEFCLDLQTDSQGNFYYFKGAPWTPDVRTPHQGTCLKVSRDGSKLEVFASGFRAPNGSAMGPGDLLTVSDNQGHWMPSSKLNVVRQGGFYGMTPAAQKALNLRFGSSNVLANPSDPEARRQWSIRGWDDGAPLPESYDQPMAWLPMAMDNSSGGQVWATSDKWGPLQGHLLFMSYGRGTLFEVMSEQVDGVSQAALIRLPMKFATGLMRGRVNPRDGQVYVCGLRGWQTDGIKDGAFYRMRYNGQAAHLPVDFHVRSNGIAITFSDALDSVAATDVVNYRVEQWNYIYSGNYGSPEVSPEDAAKRTHQAVEVRAARLEADGKTLFLDMPVRPVMQMKIKYAIKAADGTPVAQEIYNTIHRVPSR